MIAHHKSAVATALTELAEFLRTTARSESPDRELAAHAASNIEITLRTLSEAADPHSLRQTFKIALNDISERGIFDWRWSAPTEALLRGYAARVFQALDRADRYVRRHARAT